MKKKGVSYNVVRGIIKEICEEQISKEVILYVKGVLDEYLIDLAVAISRELEKVNTLRQIQSLPPMRRIDLTLIKSLHINITGVNIQLLNYINIHY